MIDHTKLALIHIIKRELQLSDAEYRQTLLKATGVRSAKDLDEKKFRMLMNYLVREDDHGMSAKQRVFIESLVHQLHWDPEHLKNFIRRYYHKESSALTRNEARKLIESLKHINAYQLSK